ncbi:unnamed protein product [Albugo candida]|uniref:Uncharacterized protein n=1 Tax=Albugo candida TaxID=65357 RepID=A0A024GM91_9STRA|nr:unnamed protein product [Albugo candida]|eukprot:CCI47657.1 unnamed protein product [Albugo candida]
MVQRFLENVAFPNSKEKSSSLAENHATILSSFLNFPAHQLTSRISSESAPMKLNLLSIASFSLSAAARRTYDINVNRILSDQVPLATNETTTTGANRVLVEMNQSAPNAANRALVEMNQSAPNAANRALVEMNQSAPNAANRALVEMNQSAPNAANRALVEMNQSAPNAANRALVEMNQSAPNAANRALVEMNQSALNAANRALVEMNQSLPSETKQRQRILDSGTTTSVSNAMPPASAQSLKPSTTYTTSTNPSYPGNNPTGNTAAPTNSAKPDKCVGKGSFMCFFSWSCTWVKEDKKGCTLKTAKVANASK